jgi:lipopolysaccharide transport system permease protein
MLSRLVRLVDTHWQLRSVLRASTRVELQKRHAGSLLGPVWTVLYPLLFLGVYLFLWLVVFRVRFPGSTSSLEYVVFVFAGLVPYLFAVESVTAAVVSIRQNIHLVKGVIIPVELIPTRAVGVALAGHAVGLGLLIVLVAASGNITARLALLPLVVALQILALVGVSWIVAPLGALVPDTAYVVNLATTLLMFVSPIAFKPEMVPAAFRLVVWLNPVTYMVSSYRLSLLRSPDVGFNVLPVFAVIAVAAFGAGALFCVRFKQFVVDLE